MARQSDNKLYTVNTDNKYKGTITQIDNIEDATDDFMTFDEVAEMLGIDPETGWFQCGQHIRRELIKEQLLDLRQQAKDKGTKTIIIRDADLMEVFKDGHSVADFVPGMRRVGERLFIEGGVQPEAKLLKKKYNEAFATLMYRVQYTVNAANRFVLDITHFTYDRHGSLDFVQKFMKFDEIKFESCDDQDTIDLCRLMWDNLDVYFERKVAEVDEK